MKTQDKTYYIGVDVSKSKLDVACQYWKIPKQFANDQKGIGELILAISDLDEQAHLVCEATGGYEQRLLDGAHENSILVSRVNARQVRDFARAKGKLAKTDRLDASMIREFAESVAPKPTKAA